MSSIIQVRVSLQSIQLVRVRGKTGPNINRAESAEVDSRELITDQQRTRFGLEVFTAEQSWFGSFHCGRVLVWKFSQRKSFGLEVFTAELFWFGSFHCGTVLVWKFSLRNSFVWKFSLRKSFGLEVFSDKKATRVLDYK